MLTKKEISAIAQEVVRLLRREPEGRVAPQTAIEEEYLDNRQAAAFLRMSPQTLYNKRDDIPRIKVGRSVRYRKSDLIRYIIG